MPGEDGCGQGGDGNPPTTRTTKYSIAGYGNKEMTRRLSTAAPPRSQQVMAADEDSVWPNPRQSDGAGGSRLKTDMHLCHNYAILAPEEPEGG